MFWTYSVASAASVSDSSEPGCEQPSSSKSTLTAKPSSESTGQMSLAMEISELSMLNQAMPILSAAGSHARMSVLPGRELVLTGIEADFGQSTRGSLAKFDPDTQSLRMSQHCFFEDLGEFSETWPRSGTMLNGTVYQRPQLARCTLGTEFGFSLIPTPTACDHKGSGRLRLERGANNNLRDWFKIKFGFLYPPVAAVEYLMGYPEGWASLKPTEIPSSRRSRK